MPSQTLHDQVLRAYILHLTLRDALIPPEDLPLTELLLRLQADMEMYRAIKNTRYLNTRTSIPKSGSLHLAWEYARRPEHHDLFIQMLRISPHTFAVLQELIKSHAVFQNNSNVPQTPVDYQLAVCLYRMGRFGNASSLPDIARVAGMHTSFFPLPTMTLRFSDSSTRPIRCQTSAESLAAQGIEGRPLLVLDWVRLSLMM